MPVLPDIDFTYLRETLVALLETPSPTGMTSAAIDLTRAALNELSIASTLSGKGALLAEIGSDHAPPVRALTAHLDTLGAMVREVKPSGRVKLTKVGGFSWTAAEGEGCLIHTYGGRVYHGSVLMTNASTHVHARKVDETKREDDTIEVRIDEKTATADETRAIGIEVGDFVSFDPRVVASGSGFIRSRHLDDKAGVACILTAVKTITDAGLQLPHPVQLHFSAHEEVGHGAAGAIAESVAELVAVDMAALGEGQNSDEFHVTVCAKDSGGPYDRELTHRLRRLAEEYSIDYRMDTYPFYGSDAEAFLRGGGDVRIGLIGPGVDASHSYERTHMDSLVATTKLIMAYLLG